MRFARIFAFNLFVFCCLASAASGANFTVTKTEDTNDGTCDAADCSLREAVAAANAAASSDAIYFKMPDFSTPKTIVLSLGEIVFANNGSITVYGTGANRLTLSGGNASRIFASSANAVVNLHHIRFTAGNGAGAVNTGRGGAVYNVGGTMTVTNSVFTGNSAANGGAMNNAASTNPAVPSNLTIINCVMSNNSTTGSGMALQNFSTSTATIINTSIISNTGTSTGTAGAVMANGTVSIINSTVSGNSAPAANNGGVYFNGTALNLTNVTITNNTSEGGGGLHRTGTNPLNVRNTIIAGNNGLAGSPDVFGPVNSQGNNIIGSTMGSTGWVMSDQQNVNPLLSPLGFFGGPGLTHGLYSMSPAINAGNNCVVDLTCAAANPPVALPADQRGAARQGTVDIGAYEVSLDYRARLPLAQVGQPYEQTLVPNLGTAQYMHTSGTFPPGIVPTQTGSSLLVSGTTGQFGTYNFAISVFDSGGSVLNNYQLTSGDALQGLISGTVVNAAGNRVSNALVVLTDQNGSTRYVRTGSFGYFNFPMVTLGATYTITVVSKQNNFPTQTITAVDALNDVVIQAQP